MFSKTLVLFLLATSTTLSFAKSVELMSFNVENLFDNLHDEGHQDYEYLPKGHPAKAAGCSEIGNDYFRGKCFGTDWNDKILKQKLNAVSDVVYRDGRQVPDILGVVEIENINVANMLKNKLGYSKAIITTGSDQRGINVAVLFRESESLKYFSHKELEVTTPEMRKPTRNVLQVTFSLNRDKKLHVFVNHWPSQNNPPKDRVTVARKLIEQIEKIRSTSEEENFFAVMGDFNVVPSDNPNGIQDVLLSRQSGMIDVESTFRQDRNIPRELKESMPPSSYFYRRGGAWNHLDRIVVSENLLDSKGIDVDLRSFEIFAHDRYSKNSRGNKVPLRFEIHHGRASGVSDHFPVSVELKLK